MKRSVALGATLALLLVPVLVRLLKAQSSPPSPPPTYTVTDLGSLNGASWINQQNIKRGPTALNANAQIAGFRFNLAFGDQPIGFRWDNGIFTDLGTGGGPQSWAFGINKAGQIAGASSFATSGPLSAFVWQNGAMTNLHPIPNEGSQANAINAGGDIAGFISPGGNLPVIWKGGTQAGELTLNGLPCSLAACQGEVLAINDFGQAAGWSVEGNVNAGRPVMWNANGQAINLIPQPTDPGTAQANAISNNDCATNSCVVVGYYQPQPSTNNLIHAFSWQAGTFTDLGTFGTDTYSGAWGINTKGDIVGISATTASPIIGGDGGRAFLRTGGVMYDLNSLLALGSNWILDQAFAINDSGQIVGIGHIAGSRDEHGFLLTPIITATTTALTTSVNPSVSGQQISFTATVTPTASNTNTITGTVNFYDGTTNTNIGAGTYNGNGVWIFNTGLSAGSHSITASYTGDNNFSASTSIAVTQAVNPAATTSSLTVSSDPAIFGLPVTLSAQVAVVAPGLGTLIPPIGTVTFFDNGAALTCGAGSQAFYFGQALCQYAFTTQGAHSLTASYSGDANFTGSSTSSPVVLTVSPPPHFVVSPPVSANAGYVFNFSVTIFNQSNGAIPLYSGTVHFTSTDPQAMLPPDYTFTTGDSGTHMFSATLASAGTQTITATDAAIGAITGISNSIYVSANPPPPGPTYTLTDLGPLGITAAPSGATALNASGQVAGFRFENFPNSIFPTAPVCFAYGGNLAFLWSNGAYTELGTLGNAPNLGAFSSAYGINNVGQIVGASEYCPNGSPVGQRAFVWTPPASQGQSATMTNLDPNTDPNDSSVAFAINNNGGVAGYGIATSGYNYAVIWQVAKDGTPIGATVLPSLPCPFPGCHAQARAINDFGQAAGWGVGSFVRGYTHAIVWNSNGQPTDLGSLGRFFDDQANAINSTGDVVGFSQLDPDIYYSIARAVLWKKGNPQAPQDLGTIPGIDPRFGLAANITDNSSSAWGINTQGFIVGISGDGSGVIAQGNAGRAFLYVPAATQGASGQMYDLLSLLAPGTNWRDLEAPWAINDNGQIIGVGIDPNQHEHGFLLTPIITPTTTILTTSGTPSVSGQSVTFTATVTPTPPNPNAVNDAVTFSDLSTTPATSLGAGTYNGNGVWILNTTLSAGTHSITASYSGDNNFFASTSNTVTQTVDQAATTLAVSAPAAATAGASFNFTVTVLDQSNNTGRNYTGTVQFTSTDGQAALPAAYTFTAADNGTHTFSATLNTAGSQTVTATDLANATVTGTSNTIVVTAAVPPPPVQILDTETIQVTDTASFPDVFDSENVKVNDAVWVTSLINVGAPVVDFSAGGLGFSGQSGTQTLTLSNIGQASLTLASATISGSSQFALTQIACSNTATSLATSLPSGGACVITVGYTVSPTPANDNGILTVADDAALSNVTSVLTGGSSYTQSISLSGSGSTTAPPPPPPAVVPVTDNETIKVTDTSSFPDVFDSEQITVTDQVTVQALNTTTTSVTINGGSVYGTPTSVIVSVSSTTAAVIGNVTLSVNGGSPSTMQLTNGSATFNLGNLTIGAYTLAANFPSQASFLGSSAAAKFAIAQATPTITWIVPGPITYGIALGGKQLNASASVAGVFNYNPPAGTVLNAGTQTLSVTFIPTDSNDYASPTATVPLQVNQATTTTRVASSNNPQYMGDPVTFTATVLSQLGGAVTTSVAFFARTAAGTTSLGTAPLIGNQASLTTSFSTTGTRSVYAQYGGDANNTGSISSLLSQSVIPKIPTTTTQTSSLNPSFVGQAVTFTVVVTSKVGAPPDGELITFMRGTNILGTAPLSSGSATFKISTLPAGTDTIIASYPGDATFSSSRVSLAQVVNKYSTSMNLSSSLNPSTYGQAVTYAATVTSAGPTTPTGSVVFRNGTTALATVAVNASGVATLVRNNLPAGTLTITATYNGDTQSASSTAALTQVVNQAVTTMTIRSSRNPSTFGQSVTFTAIVTSPTTMPTGTVTFTSGSLLLTATLAGGKASLSTTALPRGANLITATYNGTPNNIGSSGSLTQQVN